MSDSTTLKDTLGTVLEIQRMSTEDGPGLRTTVFLKGCPLRCRWCHNPESLRLKPELQWVEARCIGCRLCPGSCPEHALSANADGIAINRDLCTACGACAEQCPGTALEIMGEAWTPQTLLAEVLKDKAYFDNSQNGGVTLSGGEVTLQAPFAEAFLKAAKSAGLHTAIDTCGQCDYERLARLLPYADLVLFDLKAIDGNTHKALTGSDNRRILENFETLAGHIRKNGAPELWVRTPIIPTSTNSADHIRAIGRFIASTAKDEISRWELCAFNNLCVDKYKRLGLEWPYGACELLTKDEMQQLADAAAASGVTRDAVIWTGTTRHDPTENRTDGERSEPHPISTCCGPPRR